MKKVLALMSLVFTGLATITYVAFIVAVVIGLAMSLVGMFVVSIGYAVELPTVWKIIVVPILLACWVMAGYDMIMFGKKNFPKKGERWIWKK